MSITFDPRRGQRQHEEVRRLHPRLRAGGPTERYLAHVLSRLTAPGSLYLDIALIPSLAFIWLGTPARFPFGGTSILIIVGVGLDTVKQIQSQLQQRNYEGFLSERLLIMGPPASGREPRPGIAAHYGVPAISTGDIFRANVKNQTPLGQEVSRIMAEGGYVPDEITNADRGRPPDPGRRRGGWLLDGYPRTWPRSRRWTGAREARHAIDAVISLVADDRGARARLLKRAELEGRADDNADTIRNRMVVYTERPTRCWRSTATAACWSRSTASVASTRSPAGSPPWTRRQARLERASDRGPS